MSETEKYPLKNAEFLPSTISGEWSTATDIGRWLESVGYKVVRTFDAPWTKVAVTADAWCVAIDGYVSKTG